MELVVIAPCSNTAGEVVGNLIVGQVVENVHGNFAEPGAQLLQIEAQHSGVFIVHIGFVVEQVKGARHIDFKGRCQPLCLGLALLAQKVIQVLKGRHGCVFRVVEQIPVHHAGTAVNDGALDGL